MIFLGLGANIESAYGAPEETLRAALSLLEQNGVRIVKCSSVWRSAPVPISDQPWYKNAVCHIQTTLKPQQLLAVIMGVEKKLGRERYMINAPRTIDLDILAYDDEIIMEHNLIVPHPRLHERAFVLNPWREIAPDWVHPALNRSVDEMWDTLSQGQEIERIENFDLMNRRVLCL